MNLLLVWDVTRWQILRSSGWCPRLTQCFSMRNGACTFALRMNSNELRARVKGFAVRVVKYVQALPRTSDAQEIGRQLLRAGTGVSANYHAAGRSRSRAEWIARLGVVLEEADEAEHWLDVMYSTGIGLCGEQAWLRDESAQLRAIFQKSLITSRANHPIRR